MIRREEAERIGGEWVRGSAPPGVRPAIWVHEFDLGYVVWGTAGPDDDAVLPGTVRWIVNKETCEVTRWNAQPLPAVISLYRDRQARRPPVEHTWAEPEQAQWDITHVTTPSTVTKLRIPELSAGVAGELTVRSVKGDAPPRHHRLVVDFLHNMLPPEFRVRGYDRCSEAAAISDALHAADIGRRSRNEPRITLEEARATLFAGTELTTYWLREYDDPAAGRDTQPCLSCRLLARHFGFPLEPPLSRWPPLPDRPGETSGRFPADVAAELRTYGWTGDRYTADQVFAVADLVRRRTAEENEPIEPIPAAVEVLREFYGLHVSQYGPGRDLHRRPFVIDPTPVAACAETLAELGRQLGTRLFPVGMEGDHESILAVAGTGQVYALDHAGTWHLGDSFDEALITLITGAQPPRLDSRGRRPGAARGHHRGSTQQPPGEPPITADEARRIAAKWVRNSSPAGVTLTTIVNEFDLGYVVSLRQPPGQPPLFGAGRGIIDKETGELSVWPSLPVESVIRRYRAGRASRPQRVWTWHPASRARWDLGHAAAPATVTHLMMPEARQRVMARMVTGPTEPVHHRLVADFLYHQLGTEHREPGYDRCSEAAALSDALHGEEAARGARGEPAITLDEARAGLFSGASMRTYRVREPGDPEGGTMQPPCASCARLARHFGVEVTLPDGDGQ